VIDGLFSSGDVGHLDAAGRLFIDGRDDEMIVSGGENVFPREVEDLLGRSRAVVEVAVIGVEDEEFGQRLKAFVVLEQEARSPRRTPGPRPRPTSPPTRPAGDRVTGDECPATRPASAEARAPRARGQRSRLALPLIAAFRGDVPGRRRP
jgi:acyl-CoA synthetase (AMP-forming)/AMP-acid ligase II